MKHAIALDIGTTNIQAFLIDTLSDRQVDYLTLKNRQIVYGSDVVTRLGRSLKNPTLRDKIKKSIVEDLTLILGHFLKRKKGLEQTLDKVIACGNSAMHHMLLGLPLEGLARAPFEPAHKGKIFKTTLTNIGIKNISDNTPFLFLPNLGGFVGSDALCVIIQTGIHESEEQILSIDLGTNGEIILGSRKRILVASTSAGPAFEGWHIKCGVPGSTIIDIMNNLVKKKIIDKNGFMKHEKTDYKTDRGLVTITRKDVRGFQLAKAAISAGITILRNLSDSRDISKVYITGLFGAKLNKIAAKETGILPKDVNLNKIDVMKKAAIRGAMTLLKDKDIDKKIQPIIKKVEHIELHKQPTFQDIFTNAISF